MRGGVGSSSTLWCGFYDAKTMHKTCILNHLLALNYLHNMLWTRDPAGAAVATPAASSAILEEGEGGEGEEKEEVEEEEEEEVEEVEEEAEEEEEETEEEEEDGFFCFAAARGTTPVIPTSFTRSLSSWIIFISVSSSFAILTSGCIAA